METMGIGCMAFSGLYVGFRDFQESQGPRCRDGLRYCTWRFMGSYKWGLGVPLRVPLRDL